MNFLDSLNPGIMLHLGAVTCFYLALQGRRNLNPQPYYAEYHGHKVHMDQNEKLVMFGVVRVLAVDGYSGKIVGHSSMPMKNNITIYNEVYR